jgi:hypothetical protein
MPGFVLDGQSEIFLRGGMGSRILVDTRRTIHVHLMVHQNITFNRWVICACGGLSA